jgi:hypothetical protein
MYGYNARNDKAVIRTRQVLWGTVAAMFVLVAIVAVWAATPSGSKQHVNVGMPPAPNATGYQAGPNGAPHGAVFTLKLSGPCQNPLVSARLRDQQATFFGRVDPGERYTKLVAQNGKYSVQLVWATNECAFRPLVDDGSQPTGGSMQSIDVSYTPTGPHPPSIAEVASHHYPIHFVWNGKVLDVPCSSFSAPLLGTNQVSLTCAG